MRIEKAYIHAHRVRGAIYAHRVGGAICFHCIPVCHCK